MTSRHDPETWRRINDLFHLALDLPPGERRAAIEAACPESSEIRREALSLLAAHDRAGDFIDQPPATISHATSISAPRVPGSIVGPYRIDRVLGQGGMGIVYLAEDQRLGRVVALKAVSTDLASDPKRRDRLKREARAAASFAHAGIATVYALEEIGSEVFIATEFVAGETLREEAAQGRQPAFRVLDTAIELAEALAAAHDRGIVHRDLKPENVMRTPSGRVKVLDFGLALFRDASDANVRLTDDGTIIGTPGYMSPEQIRGETLDGRSDLFSLGILLHELINGVHPFAGRDAASTIARILESEPISVEMPAPAAPEELRLRAELGSVIRTCLRKLPSARFGSAHDLAAALDRVRRGLSGSGVTMAAPDNRPIWWWKFHQVATSVAYIALLWPVWMARDHLGNGLGIGLELASFIAVITSIVLRMHLWFTLQSLPTEWAEQRQRSAPWVRSADLLFVAVLLISGGLMLKEKTAVGVVLICAAVGVLLGFAIIEPATSRAAFRDG